MLNKKISILLASIMILSACASCSDTANTKTTEETTQAEITTEATTTEATTEATTAAETSETTEETEEVSNNDEEIIPGKLIAFYSEAPENNPVSPITIDYTLDDDGFATLADDIFDKEIVELIKNNGYEIDVRNFYAFDEMENHYMLVCDKFADEEYKVGLDIIIYDDVDQAKENFLAIGNSANSCKDLKLSIAAAEELLMLDDNFLGFKYIPYYFLTMNVETGETAFQPINGNAVYAYYLVENQIIVVTSSTILPPTADEDAIASDVDEDTFNAIIDALGLPNL